MEFETEIDYDEDDIAEWRVVSHISMARGAVYHWRGYGHDGSLRISRVLWMDDPPDAPPAMQLAA